MHTGTHIVILAAGSSSRLGRPKQLIDWRGRPLLAHLAEQALATKAPVTVILGAHAEAIRPALDRLPAEVVQNPDWGEGMSSSIRLAVSRIEGDSLLFMTCDQPHVSTGLLARIIHEHTSGRHSIVASEYTDILGVPALFDRSLFPELLNLTGDTGAKALIRQHLAQTHRIPFPAGALDLDTDEDVARASPRAAAIWRVPRSDRKRAKH